MQTSGLRSAVPPNHAATRPDLVSARVEAWQDGKGAVSKMNSDFTMAGEFVSAAWAAFKTQSVRMELKNVRQVFDGANRKRQRAAAVRDAGALCWVLVFILSQRNIFAYEVIFAAAEFQSHAASLEVILRSEERRVGK